MPISVNAGLVVSAEPITAGGTSLVVQGVAQPIQVDEAFEAVVISWNAALNA
ncbi:hypothetical protein J2T09_002709 [Neorhizobium huautlense]|uniref:Uncharacterized protein n=1 Tax=Neorhizobium huautlense TaxID=67774 RepID=A0ABT9PVR5_9HYPH|nr:hypothetical protein [Neorhizobium huautlense]MDP9837949.1 hypothetical protein [Neorhizobium huautlense]